MYDWVAELERGQWALDIGSGAGSVGAWEFSCSIVALDDDLDAFRNAWSRPSLHHVFGQAERIPFAIATFDLVICHHVLEHVANLRDTLAEISRVLKPDGRLFVSIPNGYGLCDRVYRYIFEGGGHVNRFRRSEFVDLIQTSMQVRLVRWQKLYSSFAYLSRMVDLFRDAPPDLPKRLERFGRLPRRAISSIQCGLYIGTRLIDRMASVDLPVYGWAFYFQRGNGPPTEVAPFVNVCLHCGAGHPAESIRRETRFAYRCTTCNRKSLYFPPYGGGI